MFEWFSGVKFWLIVAVIAFAVLWALNNLQWRKQPLISFSNPPSSREYLDPTYSRKSPPRRRPVADDSYMDEPSARRRPTDDPSFTNSTIQELNAAELSYIPPPPEEFEDCYQAELSRRSTRLTEADVDAMLNPPRPASTRKPNATESKGERLCKEAAERIFGEPFHRSIWPDWLRNPETGRGMELDLYSEKLKIAIEYNGRQHYDYVPYFHKKGPHELEAQKRRDAYKLDICDEKGVYVITVPYYVPDNRIEQWIRYYEPTAFALREARKAQLESQ